MFDLSLNKIHPNTRSLYNTAKRIFLGTTGIEQKKSIQMVSASDRKANTLRCVGFSLTPRAINKIGAATGSSRYQIFSLGGRAINQLGPDMPVIQTSRVRK